MLSPSGASLPEVRTDAWRTAGEEGAGRLPPLSRTPPPSPTPPLTLSLTLSFPLSPPFPRSLFLSLFLSLSLTFFLSPALSLSLLLSLSLPLILSLATVSDSVADTVAAPDADVDAVAVFSLLGSFTVGGREGLALGERVGRGPRGLCRRLGDSSKLLTPSESPSSLGRVAEHFSSSSSSALSLSPSLPLRFALSVPPPLEGRMEGRP
mmetsp:Transcript_9333/g.38278  ORF Transcript_9333/g.38278 Transcript_9333/m.38278 type:complete len:208 (+) Transcript_9333:416-1039(+)